MMRFVSVAAKAQDQKILWSVVILQSIDMVDVQIATKCRIASDETTSLTAPSAFLSGSR